MPMHDMVLSSFQTRIIGPLRRPSLAGDGLPERMRSTAFAFLGLTAAMGLALVAIFAQINFSVLSPAPMPSGPSAGDAVSEAVAVDRQARPAIGGAPVETSRGADDSAAAGADRSGADGSPAEQGGVAPPTSTAPEPGGGASGDESVEAPHSGPAPAPPPDPGPPESAEPGSTPIPAPARPATPTPAPAPGNTHSTAAAAHASERGIEASSKSGTGSPSASAAASTEPPAEASPGDGNGKALGHGK